MQILKYPLGELSANCYLLIKNNNCLLIDPGDSADFLLEEISRRNLKLIAILATHGHFDHIMAVGELQLSFNIPFLIHKKDQFLIERMKETAEHFLSYKPVIIKPVNIKYFSDKFLSLDFQCEVLHTPGHTPGSICLYFKKEKTVFTGDTLFYNDVGRTDFQYSSKSDLNDSLVKINELPKKTIAYPGHGTEFLL